jgi:hypothetical protein
VAQTFRPGVGNIALYTEGKLREKIRIYSTDSSGEVNTAANVGSGDGVFYQKSNTELQFKSLTAGTNVTISDDGSGTITISAIQSEDDVGWIARSAGQIDTTGSVGITGSLDVLGSTVLGNAVSDKVTVTGQLTGSTGAYFNGLVGIGTTPDSNYGLILPNDATTGQIKASAYVTYSDERIKTNIQPINGAIDKVKSMQGVTYNLKSGGSLEIGLIAQEIEKIAPEIVDSKSDLLGIDYSRLTPILIEAIKDQQKQIDTLHGALVALLDS